MSIPNIIFNKFRFFFFSICIAIVFNSCTESSNKRTETRVLLFTKTAGIWHESIPHGIEAIKKAAAKENILVDTTAQSSSFTEGNLKKYSAVIFLNTTGEILSYSDQNALQRFVEAGGGFVGIHAAADAEQDWPWYAKLIGAKTKTEESPAAKTIIQFVSHENPSTKGLPDNWNHDDSWYNFTITNPKIKVLAKSKDQPIAWVHEFDGGRAFYTNLGHSPQDFADENVVKHIMGGIKYAVGDNDGLNYEKVHTEKIPEDNRFKKVVYLENLNEPMELVVTKKGIIYFAERHGDVTEFDPATNKRKLIGTIPVSSDDGNGLWSLALDPMFDQNSQIYFLYTAMPEKTPIHYVSRFKLDASGMLDLSSEVTFLKIPVIVDNNTNHVGGIKFDPQGNLFIGIGDNTYPHYWSNKGYGPSDDRKGNELGDAQKSSANSNDLRGKILRIHPESDGTYTIPEGNLFPPGTPLARPEIYIMGVRNPFRMSIDEKNSVLYWGEVGPDAGDPGPLGPRGYDELNRATKAGFYGWPYFVGNNFGYNTVEYETMKIGPPRDPNNVYNNSKNNTGIKKLPPAQKPIIWYPYVNSTEFPEVGKGGRTIMAGPVYHYNPNLKSKVKLPKYYDNALFIYEWMRRWIMAVRLDEKGNYVKMEPVLPNTLFSNPMDMELGPDGGLYMLEYGTIWSAPNSDARLSKIEFNNDNRSPIVKVSADKTVGGVPFKVKFSSEGSLDYDDDEKLIYEWRFMDKKINSREPNPEFTYEIPGYYDASLTITDSKGNSSSNSIKISVGNSAPVVSIVHEGNNSFYWGKEEVNYEVKVTDFEDGKIDPSNVNVFLDYLPEGEDLLEITEGHKQERTKNIGNKLIAGSDCKACHVVDKRSIGPSFLEIAARYGNDPTAIDKLAMKVITGGAGVWGEGHAMSAHPQHTKLETTEMVKYILSLGKKQNPKLKMPLKGKFTTERHDEKGTYLLTAEYTDKGGKVVGPLRRQSILALRSPLIKAENYDEANSIAVHQDKKTGDYFMFNLHDGSYFSLKNIDLKDVDQITYAAVNKNLDLTIEVHVGSPVGLLISKIESKAMKNIEWENWQPLVAPIKDPGGINELFFVFKNSKEIDQYIMNLNTLYFNKKGEAGSGKMYSLK